MNGFSPWVGEDPREGNGNPFQYSHLENPTDRGALQATVHGVSKSPAQLSMDTHTHPPGHFSRRFLSGFGVVYIEILTIPSPSQMPRHILIRQHSILISVLLFNF